MDIFKLHGKSNKELLQIISTLAHAISAFCQGCCYLEKGGCKGYDRGGCEFKKIRKMFRFVNKEGQKG